MAELAKQLRYRRAGATYSCKLYSTSAEVGTPSLKVRVDGATAYAKLGAVGDTSASHLRVRSGGTTYAVLTQAAPPAPAHYITRFEYVGYNVIQQFVVPRDGYIKYLLVSGGGGGAPGTATAGGGGGGGGGVMFCASAVYKQVTAGQVISINVGGGGAGGVYGSTTYGYNGYRTEIGITTPGGLSEFVDQGGAGGTTTAGGNAYIVMRRGLSGTLTTWSRIGDGGGPGAVGENRLIKDGTPSYTFGFGGQPGNIDPGYIGGGGGGAGGIIPGYYANGGQGGATFASQGYTGYGGDNYGAGGGGGGKGKNGGNGAPGVVYIEFGQMGDGWSLVFLN